MQKYHLVIVTGLVSAIAACLMVRTPNASASIESITHAPQATESRPSLLVAQSEPLPDEAAPTPGPAPAVENGAPPNDPVLNEALAKEQKEGENPMPPPAQKKDSDMANHEAPHAPAVKGKPLKDAHAFAQSPKPARESAGVKSKKSSKKKKPVAKKPAKKKKKKTA